jgi:hypothetical protein
LHGSETIQILLEPFYHGIGKYLIATQNTPFLGLKARGISLALQTKMVMKTYDPTVQYSTVPFKLNF